MNLGKMAIATRRVDYGNLYLLDDPLVLVAVVRRAIEEGGATLLRHITHRFKPQGFTALFLLSESHVSIHTWPESGEFVVDVYTCGEMDPEKILDRILEDIPSEGPKEVFDRSFPKKPLDGLFE